MALPWAVTWPILILAFANICSFADRQLTSILAKPISASLLLDHAHMALLGGTAFAVLYGVAGLPAGLLADRVTRRWLIFGAISFWSVCTALCGLAPNFQTLFLARLGVGLGEAVLLPCAFSLIRDLVAPERRGYAFFLFGLGIPLGTALGLIVGGVLNTALSAHPEMLSFLGEGLQGWQKTFLILAVLGAPAALLTLRLPEPPRRIEAAKASGASAADQAMSPLMAALCFFLAVAGAGIMIQGIGFWTPTMLIERFHMTTGQVGLRMGLTNIGAATLGMFLAGMASDRLTARYGARGGAYVLAFSLAALAPAALLLSIGSAASWLGVGLFYFAAIGFTAVASALALQVGPARRAGLMGAVYGLVVNVAGHGLGPLLYGALKDHFTLSLAQVVAFTTAPLALVSALAALGVGLALSRRRAGASAS